MSNRRDFLKTTTGAALALSTTGVFAQGNDVIKVGVIGCGGRGSGAAENCIDSSPNVKIVALGDAFQDRVDGLRNRLIKSRKNNVDLPAERCFAGLDAYQHVINAGVDLVILATPPGFRPQQIQAAVAAGKHVFTEKPVAVDGPGIRKCLDAYEEAKKKNLCIVAGTQRRHQNGYLETIKRLHDGAIGEILTGRCYWNQGPIWFRPRREGQTDVQFQVNNWYHFVWTCGDHICEQHVHNLDVINWVLKSPPLQALGMGGRVMPCKDPNVDGHIYNFFAIQYEYPNGVQVLSQCRQIGNTDTNFKGTSGVSEAVVGTKGSCQVNNYAIKGGENWKYTGPGNEPYVQEHTDLINAIRGGKPLNELKTVSDSTLTAIMGRMSAYTGKVVTWDQALNSKLDTFPVKLDWNLTLQTPDVAVPGRTPLI